MLGPELIGLLVGSGGIAVGILFGSLERRHARQSAQRLQKLLEHVRVSADILKTVAEEMPTRAIGTFPDYAPAVVSLLAKSRNTISILGRWPGFAMVSDSASFDRYCAIIREKVADGQQVSLVCFDQRTRVDANRALYGDWEGWKGDPRTLAQLQDFAGRYAGDRERDINRISLDDWVQLVEECDQEVLARTFFRAATHEIDLWMPLMICIVDHREAIFALVTEAPDTRGLAFHTTDHSLIAALDRIFEQYLASDGERFHTGDAGTARRA